MPSNLVALHVQIEFLVARIMDLRSFGIKAFDTVQATG
jgi:hypothetical protein